MDCGCWTKASTCRACHRLRLIQCPHEELAGTYGNGRRIVQTFCTLVLRVPISLGAIQKVLDRVTRAIDPYYAVIARQARQAAVNYIDETPWYCLNALEWLWVMASERVAFYMIHPRRSKEAFAALIDDWEGILVSDGYGVYQRWVEARQTCVAHLTGLPAAWRTASLNAAAVGPGHWQMQRLCPYGHGTCWERWRACCSAHAWLISIMIVRTMRASWCAACSGMDSLWVFLAHHGVEPTNNRAERALPLGSMAGALVGTASEKGNRWVERILSLKETCGCDSWCRPIRPRGGRGPFLHRAAAPTHAWLPVALTPHFRCGHYA